MGKYVLAAVLVSSLLTLFLLPVRKGLRRFVGKYRSLCTVAVCGDQPAFAISTDGL